MLDSSIGAPETSPSDGRKFAAVIDPRAPSGPRLLTLAACAGRYRGGETIRALCGAVSRPTTCPKRNRSYSGGLIAERRRRTSSLKSLTREEVMPTKSSSAVATRRKFLKGAAVATAATVAAPSVVKAQGPINMRWQSTWPSKDIFHEYA